MKDQRTSKLVLIVDDDNDARIIYEGILVRHRYGVLTASQGAEGVQMARRHSPDLILMDIHMPVMDGADAAWYLKSDPVTARIPICGITGYYSKEEAQQLPNAENFNCILAKASDPSNVVAVIESIIGPASPSRL